MEPYSEYWVSILVFVLFLVTGLGTIVRLAIDYVKQSRQPQGISTSACVSIICRLAYHQGAKYLMIPIAVAALTTAIGYGLDYLWPHESDPYYFLLQLTIVASPAWFVVIVLVVVAVGSVFGLAFAGMIVWLAGLKFFTFRLLPFLYYDALSEIRKRNEDDC